MSAMPIMIAVLCAMAIAYRYYSAFLAARVAAFNNTNGAYPDAGLTLSGSTLYGTTSQGGASGYDTVFSLTPVPEPASLSLLMGGMILLGRRSRRRA